MPDCPGEEATHVFSNVLPVLLWLRHCGATFHVAASETAQGWDVCNLDVKTVPTSRNIPRSDDLRGSSVEGLQVLGAQNEHLESPEKVEALSCFFTSH